MGSTFLLFCFLVNPVDVDPAITKAKVIEAIDVRVKLLAEMGVRYTTSRGGVDTTAMIKTAGAFQLFKQSTAKQKGAPETHYAHLSNLDYVAELKSRNGNDWSISRFALAGDPLYEEINQAFVGNNSVEMYGVNLSSMVGDETGSLVSLLNRIQPRDLSSNVSNSTGPIVLSGKAKTPPGVPDNALVFTSVSITIDDDLDGFFSAVDAFITIPMGEGQPDQQVPMRVRNSDWVTVDGLAMPQLIRYWANGDVDETPYMELKVAYGEVALDQAECRLSFYGLPEPELPGRTWPYFVVAMIILGVGSLLFFRSR